MIKVLHIVGELTYDGILTWIETFVDAANKNELKIDILGLLKNPVSTAKHLTSRVVSWGYPLDSDTPWVRVARIYTQ